MATAIRPPEPAAGAVSLSQSGQGVVTLADALDRILHRGVVVQGDLMIGLAGVDLVYLDARLLLGSVDTIWPEGRTSIDGMGPREPPPAPRAALPPPAQPAPGQSAPEAGAPALDPEAPGRGGAAAAPGAAVPAASETADLSSALAPAKPKETPAEGLARLVLTIVNLLHDVLERQAVRRMTGGNLTDGQIEDIGMALFAQAQELQRLREYFGFSERDLDLNLGRLDALG